MNERMKRRLQFFCFNFLITLNSPLEMGATWQSNRLPTPTPTTTHTATPAQAPTATPTALRGHTDRDIRTPETGISMFCCVASCCLFVCLFVFVCSGLCRHVSGWAGCPPRSQNEWRIKFVIRFCGASRKLHNCRKHASTF